jgi:hypothetical protein
MSGWTVPANSFNATTLVAPPNQNGATVELAEILTEHACEVIVVCTTAGDEVLITLQGSLDGANWYSLGSAGVPAGGAAGAGTTSVLIAATGQAALFTRANGYGAKGAGGSVFPVVTTLHTSGPAGD